MFVIFSKENYCDTTEIIKCTRKESWTVQPNFYQLYVLINWSVLGWIILEVLKKISETS